MDPKKVLIIGGGFGGLACARKLAGRANVDVTLIDRRNYHLFQPLLYQVATAGLSPSEIATPIRAVFRSQKNVKIFLDNVIKIDFEKNQVVSPKTNYDFDYLVLACGAKHSYFGHNEWEPNAPGLKTLEQATEIRRRILLSFEEAEKETDVEKQKQLLTFVIIGAGPTGVELAGAISEISRFTLAKDFRLIDPKRTRVILIEAGPRVLAGFDPELSKRATDDLESLGVSIWTNSRVTNVTDDKVFLGEEVVLAKTVLWAAGVQPSSLTQQITYSKDKIGRVVVGKDLAIPDKKNVFVVGDMSHFEDSKMGVLPGLAPVAMQQGRHVAQIILTETKAGDGQAPPRIPFKYVDKGQMATIGRRKAVAQFKGLRMSGWFAWMAWLFVHIYFLIGFKNRIFVLMNWAWSYITLKKGARLIVNNEWRSVPPTKPN